MYKKNERKRECEIYSLTSSHWSFDQEMKDKKRVIGISCGQYKFIPFKKVPIGHLDADYLDLCIFPFFSFLFGSFSFSCDQCRKQQEYRAQEWASQSGMLQLL